MKAFEVTAIISGKIEKWIAYGNSKSHVRNYIIKEWNYLLDFESKIINILVKE